MSTSADLGLARGPLETGAQSTVMAPQPSYQVNRAASKRRAKRLQSYLSKHVWDPSTRRAWPDFICASKDDCKASAVKRSASFHEAQGHAVGDCYDLWTLAAHPSACSSCRWKLVEARDISASRAVPTGFGIAVACRGRRKTGEEFRNAHMKGVTLALRLALGLPYKDRHGQPLIDHQTERVTFTDGTDAHLFECFAMANLLLCSAVLKDGSQKSLATPVMGENCAEHLVETIRILKPTLVISQGWSLVETLRDSFGVIQPINLTSKCNLADCDLTATGSSGRRSSPDTELEHDQTALFPGNCRSRYYSRTQAGAKARADGLSSTAPTVIGAASDDGDLDQIQVGQLVSGGGVGGVVVRLADAQT